MIDIVKADPAVANVVGFSGGGGTTNTARLFIALKPLDERDARADQIIARLRPKLAQVPGATLYLQASQDVRVGGRLEQRAVSVHDAGRQPRRPDGLRAEDAAANCSTIRIITDVNSDQQNHGLQALRAPTTATRPRATASRRADRRHALRRVRTAAGVDDVPRPEPVSRRDGSGAGVLAERRRRCNEVYVRSPQGQEVPLSAFASWAPATAPLAVNHQGLFPAVTISFNLAPGVALGDAVTRDRSGGRATSACRRRFTRCSPARPQAYQESLGSEPMLIATALAAVFIVLGMLYESYIHPITILSTIPSAGVGALLALMLTRHRPHGDRDDRHHPAHRHRQEERDHDGGFRAGRRTARRQEPARRDLRSLLCCASDRFS